MSPTRRLGTVAVAALLSMALTATPAIALNGITPAGHTAKFISTGAAFTATFGEKAPVKITVGCSSSITGGTIPNPLALTMSIEAPTFNNGGGSTECASSATVEANEVNGKWALTENALTQGTITIPEAGLRVNIGSCSWTYAPTGAANLTQANNWTNGTSAMAPSQLKLANVTVSARGTGGCPGALVSATVSFIYTVIDQTEPEAPVKFT
jgi:hypothetical protein